MNVGEGMMYSMSKNRVKLNICGADYVIISDEPEEYMKEIASMVDDEMRETIEKNDRISMTMSAVLSALKYCDEFVKATRNEDNLRDQIKSYLEECAKYRSESDSKDTEIARLKKQIEDLNLKLKETEMKISVLGHVPAKNTEPHEFDPSQTMLYPASEAMNDDNNMDELMEFFKADCEQK